MPATLERAQKLIERPRRSEVGCLSLEGGSDAVGTEVVEVDQEVVRMNRLDAERVARLGGKVVEVEGDDQLGSGGDCGREDMAVLGGRWSLPVRIG